MNIDILSLSHEAKQNIKTWLEFGEDVKKEIEGLISANKIEELEERFYKKLEFGTGGMRGKMGIGTNRINKYTVQIATQGYVNYLSKVYQDQEKSCVIGYDTRRNSYEFAIEAAKVLVANGIKTYVIKIPMPTPFLSFAIRYLRATGGIVITASHNPPEYNGYKVYWSDGGQVVSPHDKGIIQEFYKISHISEVRQVSEDELKKSSLFSFVLDEVKDAYLKVMKINLSQIHNLHDPRENVSICYTPLHGTGQNIIPDALKYIGFENIHIVEEERNTDGTFSAVLSPNPENDNALDRVVKLAKETKSQVFFATDPDADRVRAGIINSQGEVKLFNGNQMASMMLNWILSKLLSAGQLPENGFVVTTIVTTDLISKIAQNYGVEVFLTLTGFKYIAEKIKQFEGKKRFIFGCEESIGFLYGDDVRDKDSIISTALFSLMVEDLYRQGRTLDSYLDEIYQKYGYHIETQISLDFEGIEGMRKIEEIVNKARNGNLPNFAGFKPLRRIDIKSRIVDDFRTGQRTDYETDLPNSNVVIVEMEKDKKFIIRPSGTEPKVKVYFFSKFGPDIKKENEYKSIHNQIVEDVKNYLLF